MAKFIMVKDFAGEPVMLNLDNVFAICQEDDSLLGDTIVVYSTAGEKVCIESDERLWDNLMKTISAVMQEEIGGNE